VTTAGANIDEVSAVRTPDGVLHVAWSPGINDLATQLLASTISPSGAVGGATTLTSGWSGIGNPAIARRADGSLVVVAGAQRSLSTTDSIFNQALWSSMDGGGTWSLRPADIAAGSGPSDPVSLAFGPDGSTPFTTWANTFGTFVHRGTDASVPAVKLQSAAGWGGCCGYDPGIAFDQASQQLVVAWYSNGTGHSGVYAQRIDPSTAAPIGAPAQLPGSATQGGSLPPDERTELVARPGGGIYLADAGGYPSGTRALVWRFGSGAAMTVGTAPRQLQDAGVAADPKGRLWAFWVTTGGGVRLHARRSNPEVTRWGAEVVVNPPAGQSNVWKLGGNAQSGRLDLLGSFTVAGSAATWDTEVLPGLSLGAEGHRGATVTAMVTDAGQPVKGAVVRGFGHAATTNAAGVAHLSFGSGRRPRTVPLTAAKLGYTSAAGAVRVQG
jgi:hypothetical protein